MKAYILPKMTWPEVEKALKEVKIAIVPIGAQEQHGPHIAEGCDSYRSERFSELLAERCYPHVIVTPTVTYGVSPHHMDFPGTISLRPETLMAILEDIVSSLVQHGIKKFLFINGHGGNSATISVAANILTRKYQVEIASSDFIKAAVNTTKAEVHSEHFGHACEREVSECLYLAPEIVREDQLQAGNMNLDSFPMKYRKKPYINIVNQFKEITNSGNLGDGTKASYELGKKFIEEALENISEFIMDFKDVQRNE